VDERAAAFNSLTGRPTTPALDRLAGRLSISDELKLMMLAWRFTGPAGQQAGWVRSS
jgi:hypothetical protein